ncbi:hypothetical protein FB451DRAFT_1257512 [Mycena latifolia]|nr:hypothetical protein FB451DRAFT_1257512 [Mycena latifolia]
MASTDFDDGSWNAQDRPYAVISTTSLSSARLGFHVRIPIGWKTTVVSRSYTRYVRTQYGRGDAGEGRHTVRTVLMHKPGAEDGKMREMITGSDVVQVHEFEAEALLHVSWYVNQIQDESYASRTDAKKIIDAAAEVVYEIKVFDKAGNHGEHETPDQITTIRLHSDYPVNLVNIQGDVIPGLPKALEYFYYFKITDIKHFKRTLRSFALRKIVTSFDLIRYPPPPPQTNKDHPFVGFNIAFTSLGVQLFGLDPAEIGDSAFLRGQMADARSLGDPGTGRGEMWSPDWDAEFKTLIHGIFLITAYNEANALGFIQELEAAFTWAPKRSAIKKVVNFHGYPRPGEHGPNDPFGYRGGGMTNPQVKGLTFTDTRPMRYTGTPVVPIGVIVMGREGDEDKDRRPKWAVDGSLIATRKLNCLVPEFDKYCMREGVKLFPKLARNEAAAKLGARLMGRWKNGTPVAISPDHDAPDIARDDSRVNNFEFDQSDVNQRTCPFAAHMRKSNPRNDVPPEERLKHLIRRHNMPYGPEVTDDEKAHGTVEERGLHMCTYQSSLERGFRFIQRDWYNDPEFPPGKPLEPGWDPVFGQTGEANTHRYTRGVDPSDPTRVTSFHEQFIDPRGGEYFFSPSLTTLREYFC